MMESSSVLELALYLQHIGWPPKLEIHWRDLTQIFAHGDCRGLSSSVLENAAQESTNPPRCLEFSFIISYAGALPLPLARLGGAFIVFLEGLAPPSLMTISHASFRVAYQCWFYSYLQNPSGFITTQLKKNEEK